MTEFIKDISDTARWVAHYRALESDRPDALFQDPFAKILAGDRGQKIARHMDKGINHGWILSVRTHIIDGMILWAVRDQKVDTVLNLASGLDARPYRMDLPSALQWIEVDLPPLLSYKQEVLHNHSPRCKLEQIKLDLSDQKARFDLFSKVNSQSKKVLVLTEGLLVYLSSEENRSLAEDISQQSHFRYWIMDIHSPIVLSNIPMSVTEKLKRANVGFKFAPKEGAKFYRSWGWTEKEYRSYLEEGQMTNRLPSWGWAWKMSTKLFPKKQIEKMRKVAGISFLEKKSC